MPDAVVEKQLQYIKMLEERNRLKKKLAAAAKQQHKEERKMHEREEAFVTTFNVPPKATGASSGASTQVRKNKSSASLVPTRMKERSDQCRSAPTIGWGNGGSDGATATDGGHDSKPRAKWKRPDTIAVENRNGKARLCFDGQPSDHADAKIKGESDGGGDDEGADEESYLEESFEEFEEEQNLSADDGEVAEDIAKLESVVSNQKPAIESKPSTEAATKARKTTGEPTTESKKTTERTAISTSATLSTAAHGGIAAPKQENGGVDLSRTTTALIELIQNLSREKQKTLVNVLQNFQQSDQHERDVRTMRESIGDPHIWKQVTAALFTGGHEAKHASAKPTASETPETAQRRKDSLTLVLQEHAKWEEDYTRQLKSKLLAEREAKEREADERRKVMLQQMEEEDRELERLMERKRQERLRKLEELDRQMDEDIKLKQVERERLRTKSERGSTTEGTAPSARMTDPVRRSAQKNTPSSPTPVESPTKKKKKRQPVVEAKQSKEIIIIEEKEPDEPPAQGPSAPVVPLLNLSAVLADQTAASRESSSTEIRIKLLSAWGKTRAIGLTQVSVYDETGDEMTIDVGSARVYEQLNDRPLPKTSEIETQVSFQVPTPPSKLCIWNYNSKRCTASARDVEVTVGGKLVWTGSLPETFGNEDGAMCVWVDVHQSTRRTARATARAAVDETPSSRTTFRAAADETQQFKATAAAAPAASTAEQPPSAPMWLRSSTSSPPGALTPSGSMTSLWAEDKDGRGCQSARRRQAKDEPNDADWLRSSSKEIREDERSGGARTAREATQSAREPMRSIRHESKHADAKSSVRETLTSSHKSDANSWDSLEHFRKSNFSRLAQPIIANAPAPDADSAYDEAPVSAPKLTRQPTTSSLLAELRGGLVKTGSYASLPAPTPGEHAAPVIPELPAGQRITMEIFSTWGDPYYVGLNGIEVFDDHGKPVQFENPELQVTAIPDSINVLDEYTNDPRVPKNLVDGVPFTCDDFHMWLAPFTVGEEHSLRLDMGRRVSISMIRVWNYNKSRAHSTRGVRHVRLILDNDSLIFEGEVPKAPGLVSEENMDNCCEVVLFTREDRILKAIEQNDEVLKRLALMQEREEEEISSIIQNVRSSMEQQRPRTSDKGRSAGSEYDQQREEVKPPRAVGNDGRPMTAAQRPPTHARSSMTSWVCEEPQEKSPVLSKIAEREETDSEDREDDDTEDSSAIRGRRITIKLMSTWGDRNYIGLTQLDVLVGSQASVFPMGLGNLDASPRDLHTLGYTGDPRTLDKLIDGVGTTCDDTHMWLVPFSAGGQELRIDLKKEHLIHGLRIWNYNKSDEDTFRGAKQIDVLVDGVSVAPRGLGFIVRKAPGTDLFDFHQDIRLTGSNGTSEYIEKLRHPFQTRTYKTPLVRQDYEAPMYPQGFTLKLIFWSTWGDPYYLGLNGLEIYDYHGRKLTERPAIIMAKPFSVGEVHGNSDMRVPSNLLNGLNKNTWDGRDTWLAPLASSLGLAHGNQVYIVFDHPVVISMIKIWNYSKSPERGAKDVDIYLDDLHLFSGSLRKAPMAFDGHARSKHQVVQEFSQPILFSASQAQVDTEKRKVWYCGSEEQDVLCINEGQVMQESKAMYRDPDPGAEGVVVNLDSRPTTAMCR
ncbi:TPA: hypothetical protein N0F65_006203 [Lagenidium giganteum]|uniref:KATNIP domain-containing protein n=1 Tax=Lagenidium giganteum TaxID=4803 RepID=A0AAV2ZAS8_9STRA|nr:TPA: hypothetical protein N0F65_006203 [Lagenidium giganteum]